MRAAGGILAGFWSVIASTAGVTGHWPLDEGAGPVAADTSGMGHDGSLVGGVTWVAGDGGGNALGFDGVDGRLDIANPDWDGQYWSTAVGRRYTITWEFRIRTTTADLPAADGGVMAFTDTAAASTHIDGTFGISVVKATGASAGRLRPYVNGDGGANDNPTIPIDDGDWHDVRVVWEVDTTAGVDDTITTFVDSEPGVVNTADVNVKNGAVASWASPGLVVGFNENPTNAGAWDPFKGEIDDVRISAVFPLLVGDQQFGVDDGAAPGTVVGTVVATGGQGPVSFSIVSGNDGGAFALDPSSGEITVAGTLDFAARPSYALVIEADDGVAPVQATVTVDVVEPIGRAVISWGEPRDTAGKADLIEGPVVIAYNAGTLAPLITGGGAGGTGTYQFTPAVFNSPGFDFRPTGEDAGDTPRARSRDDIYTPDAIATTGDSAFDDLVKSIADSYGDPTGINTGTLVLRGLQAGGRYSVQVFYNDQRDGNEGRVMRFGDGNGNDVGLLGGDITPGVQIGHYGQFVVGSFTAVDDTQALTMETDATFGNVHFSAVLVTSASGVRITGIERDGATVSLTWESSPGALYQAYRSLDLVSWTLLETSPSHIPGAGSPAETTTFGVDAAAIEPQAFYRVVPVPSPPLFADDFEGVELGWLSLDNGVTGNSRWERGTPTVVGPSAAHSPVNCHGVDLAGPYDNDLVNGAGLGILLRSPLIDLHGAASATLRFWQYLDVTGFADEGYVRFLDASGTPLVPASGPYFNLAAPRWEMISLPLPPEVIANGELVVEWEFISQADAVQNGSGWYIDDVVVSE